MLNMLATCKLIMAILITPKCCNAHHDVLTPYQVATLLNISSAVVKKGAVMSTDYHSLTRSQWSNAHHASLASIYRRHLMKRFTQKTPNECDPTSARYPPKPSIRRYDKLHLTYFLSTDESRTISQDDASQAMAEAARIWSAKTPMQFEEVHEGPHDFFVSVGKPTCFNGTDETKKEYACSTSHKMRFNNNYDWFYAPDQYNDPNTKDVINMLFVAMHELGHVVGLAHTCDENKLMYPTLVQRFELDDDTVTRFNELYEPVIQTQNNVAENNVDNNADNGNNGPNNNDEANVDNNADNGNNAPNNDKNNIDNNNQNTGDNPNPNSSEVSNNDVPHENADNFGNGNIETNANNADNSNTNNANNGPVYLFNPQMSASMTPPDCKCLVLRGLLEYSKPWMLVSVSQDPLTVQIQSTVDSSLCVAVNNGGLPTMADCATGDNAQIWLEANIGDNRTFQNVATQMFLHAYCQDSAHVCTKPGDAFNSVYEQWKLLTDPNTI